MKIFVVIWIMQNYAKLLQDHLNEYDEASQHYLYVLKTNLNDINLHYNFATFFERSLRHYDNAKEHYLKY